jgi:hypothetical protein
MFWKGKEIKTIDNAMEALRDIHTKEEAAEYLRLAKEEGPYAEQNIGYLFGYFNRDRWKELSELFGVLHPLFGDNYNLTDDEILQMGIARGEASKRKRDGQD